MDIAPASFADIMLVIPEPPSSNRIWRVFRGRMAKSPAYRRWMTSAAASIAEQLGGDGVPSWFSASITLPPSRRDPDNSVKPILDAIQAGGAISNDRLLRRLTLAVDDDREPGTVSISLWPAAEPKAKPRRRKKP